MPTKTRKQKKIESKNSNPISASENYQFSSDIDESDQEFYNVEKILDRQIEPDGSRTYLIKWEGYPESQCTWEPLENLYNVIELVEKYEENLIENEKAKYALEIVDQDLRIEEIPSMKDNTSENVSKMKKGNITATAAGQEEDVSDYSEPKKRRRVIIANEDVNMLGAEEDKSILKDKEIPFERLEDKNTLISTEAKSDKPEERKDSRSRQKKKVLPLEGHFKHKDKPKQIVSVKASKDGTLRFTVTWFKRSDGTIPKDSTFTSDELRNYDHNFLLDFYESKIVLCSKKSKQQLENNRESEDQPSELDESNLAQPNQKDNELAQPATHIEATETLNNNPGKENISSENNLNLDIIEVENPYTEQQDKSDLQKQDKILVIDQNDKQAVEEKSSLIKQNAKPNTSTQEKENPKPIIILHEEKEDLSLMEQITQPSTKPKEPNPATEIILIDEAEEVAEPLNPQHSTEQSNKSNVEEKPKEKLISSLEPSKDNNQQEIEQILIEQNIINDDNNNAQVNADIVIRSDPLDANNNNDNGTNDENLLIDIEQEHYRLDLKGVIALKMESSGMELSGIEQG